MIATQSLGAGTTYFTPPAHPAELDFRTWLAGRTPPGAPTLAVRAPGARATLHLPRIRPPALAPPARRGRRRRGAAPALHAAFLADLEGFTPRQLARSGVFEFSTERGGRQHVREGRFVAAKLGLWPWAVVGGQGLTRSWWADERFALALQWWAVGELHPLAVGRAVQPIRSRRFLPSARLPVA